MPSRWLPVRLRKLRRPPSPHRRRHLLAATGLLLGLAALAGCDIVSVTGPTLGALGQVLSYEITIEHQPGVSSLDAAVWLMADIPVGWSVVAASYTGEIDGNPVSGTPAQGPPTANDIFCFTDSPAEGYQRMFFSDGPFAEIGEGDHATVTLDLLAGGGEGDYTLAFRAATETGPPETRGLGCRLTEGNPPQPVTVTYDVTVEEAAIVEVPTLGSWGAGLLLLLLAGLGLRRLAGA